MSEIAWAAGFFEGEGNVYVPPANQGRGLRLTVAQSSDDGPPATLLRFRAVVGVGSITPLGPSHLSVKQRWAWRVQRRSEAENVLRLLAPYLTTPPVFNREYAVGEMLA